MTTIRAFYNKYTNILQLNKNLIISGTVAFFVSAAVAELYSKYNENDFWISAISILTGFFISIPLFVFLFHIDNKHKYTGSITGETNHTSRNLNIKRLATLFSISKIVNAVVRFIILYELLKLAEMDPFEASMLSSLLASGLSYFVTNIASKSLSNRDAKVGRQSQKRSSSSNQ
jgi:hypothetical protein